MYPTYSQVRQVIEADVQAIAVERQKVQTFTKRWVTILVTVAALLLGYQILVAFWTTSVDTPISLVFIIGGIGVVIALIVMLIITSINYNKLRKLFKLQVISRMAKEIIQQTQMPDATKDYSYTCDYQPGQHVSPMMVRNSKLFDFQIDKYRGEDLFTGQIGLTKFEFSELQLIQVQTSTDSKGNTTRRDVTMFKGILFLADFNKKFNGITTLHADNFVTNSFLGKLFQPFRTMSKGSYNNQKKLSIDVESEEFNRAFEITTTDEIEARYILSSSMIQRILSFRQRNKQRIELSFVDSLICISLSDQKNYFEMKKFGKNIEQELEGIYHDFLFFFGMIEEFDLNTRIWTKN